MKCTSRKSSRPGPCITTEDVRTPASVLGYRNLVLPGSIRSLCVLPLGLIPCLQLMESVGSVPCLILDPRPKRTVPQSTSRAAPITIAIKRRFEASVADLLAPRRGKSGGERVAELHAKSGRRLRLRTLRGSVSTQRSRRIPIHTRRPFPRVILTGFSLFPGEPFRPLQAKPMRRQKRKRRGRQSIAQTRGCAPGRKG